MNRNEYMSKLSDALNEFTDGVKQEIMEDYEEHYEIGIQHGKSEEQISEELGDIEELVRELRKSENSTIKKSSLSDSNATEYSVYVSAEQPKKEEPIENTTELMKHIPERKSSSSEKQGTPSDQGHRLKRIVLRSKFAQVDVTASIDGEIHMDWVNYPDSRAREYYEFRTWEEGTTVYGEICRKSIGGLFANVFGGEIRIHVRVPEGFPELEIQSMSGDTALNGCNIQSIRAGSLSGNVDVQNIIATQLSFDSKSGDIQCRQIKSGILNAGTLSVDTKSGDISVTDIQTGTVHARTLSGDVEVQNVQGTTMFSSASGDVRVHEINGKQIDVSSISGDVELKNAKAEKLRVNTKSGDIRVEASATDNDVSSISGDIEICNSGDGRMNANTVSGDINIRLYQAGGYEADVHTVSGTADLFYSDRCSRNHGNGTFTCGNGSSKLQVRTTSGDIQIQA